MSILTRVCGNVEASRARARSAKSRLKTALLLPVLALVPGPASAVTEYNKSISRVGVQGNNGYVVFVAPPTGGCTWGNVYLSITTDAGKSYYALLLTAYSSGRPLSRIDYTKQTDGTCTVDLVEM